MTAPPAWTGLPHISAADIGLVLKTARIALGLDQDAAGARCGYSGSTVCRWELGRRNWTIEDLANVAAALDVPGHLVGLAETPTGAPGGPVVPTARIGHDEPMKRRTLIAASITAVTGAAFAATRPGPSIEHALFNPAATEPVPLRLLAGRIAAAEGDLDAARLGELNRRLPTLLETAQATWDAATGTRAEQAASLLSRVLAVTGQQQIRLSREPIASVAADRAARFAALARDAVAAAEAARVQATVLRRAGSPVADQVMVNAAEKLRADTGLRRAPEAGMYAKVIAAAAYTAAGHDDRDTTAELLAAARGALAPFGDTPHMAGADLDVFAVSCDRVLGDHGAALHHARAVDLAAIPDTHQKGRFWQEVAISASGRGRIDLAIEALAELDDVAPQYLRPRTWAQDLVTDLLATRTGGATPLLHRLAGQLQLT